MRPDARHHSMIRQYFHGRRLLVTGGTGFVGQALIAKVLTTLGDEVECIYALIRPRRRTDGQVIDPAQRLREVFEGSVFDPLRADPQHASPSPSWRAHLCHTSLPSC